MVLSDHAQTDKQCITKLQLVKHELIENCIMLLINLSIYLSIYFQFGPSPMFPRQPSIMTIWQNLYSQAKHLKIVECKVPLIFGLGTEI